MDESRLLQEMKKQRRRTRSALDPARKMATAFFLSTEARKMLVAGLKNQGFSETEILQILKTRRR
jgi:hypothetical protein